MKEIELTRGRVALVDDEDFEKLSGRNFTAIHGSTKKCFYAITNLRIGPRRQSVKMHRIILNAPPGAEVDHKNGNTLDNRKENLRLTNRFGNCQNAAKKCTGKSPFKGVSPVTGCPTWRARIQTTRGRVHLGCFETQEQAARAYDAAAKEHFGEFARLNFPL